MNTWCWPQRSTLDELCLDKYLAAVVLASGYVIDPAHDAPDHRIGVSIRVGNGGPTSIEARIGVAADQRDILRHLQPSVAEELQGWVKQ